ERASPGDSREAPSASASAWRTRRRRRAPRLPTCSTTPAVWARRGACTLAGSVGAPVFVHMRGGDPIAAFEEVLALAAATGTPLHIVHAQSSGGRQTPALLQLLGRARGRGIDVTTEMYPYTASQTRIESALYDDWERYTDERFQTRLWPATGERLTRDTFAKYRKQGGSVISFGNTEEV